MSKNPEIILRSILSKDMDNMACFECGKSPVTFVNLISWSFCCQVCSGLIFQFGRVKSLSSATFSPNEIELLQTIGGNRNAKLIWMHKFIPGNYPIKQVIEWKYKDRKWYNPDMMEEIRRQDKKVVVSAQGIEAPTLSRRRKISDDYRSPFSPDVFTNAPTTIQNTELMSFFNETPQQQQQQVQQQPQQVQQQPQQIKMNTFLDDLYQNNPPKPILEDFFESDSIKTAALVHQNSMELFLNDIFKK